jgi:hypothetical protein
MENEFSIVNTVIAWKDDPLHLEFFPLGEHIPREYMFTSGAAYVKVRGMSKEKAETYVLAEAIKLMDEYYFPSNFIISQFRRLKEFNNAMRHTYSVCEL